MTMSSSSHQRVRLFGAIILVVGFAVAGWVWLAQNAANGDESMLDSRKQVRQLQVYYGQSGVVFEQWTEWLKSLFHGKRLAAAIAVVSIIIALPCLVAADRVVAFVELMKTPPEPGGPSQG